jgi:hypothetical protein
MLECGSSVSSVITPPEQGIKDYEFITGILNLLLVVGVILRLSVKESDAYSRPRNNRVLPTTAIENFLIALNLEMDNNRVTNIQQPVFRRIHNMLWLSRMTSNDRSRAYERFLSQMNTINLRMNMIQQWKIKTTEEDQLNPQSECPICLNDLFIYEAKKKLKIGGNDGNLTNEISKNSNNKVIDWSDPDILANAENGGVKDGDIYDSSNQNTNAGVDNKSNDSTIVVELPCNHCFHRSCLLQWTSSGKTTCPICRANLQADR